MLKDWKIQGIFEERESSLSLIRVSKVYKSGKKEVEYQDNEFEPCSVNSGGLVNVFKWEMDQHIRYYRGRVKGGSETLFQNFMLG